MQGFNKYYPPDYQPESGSLNKLNGKHALGDRARKIDQGILITRFEIPYNIWCAGCDNHIGMGVRFNAEKSKVGMYFTTPVFNFRCKCHLCSNWFEIRTDPQNTRYVVHSGARQKNEEWDPAENGGFVLEEKLPETSDAFDLIDRSVKQKTKALSAAASLDALQDLQERRTLDPYTLSSKLRSKFRKEKKITVASESRAGAVRDKYGLGERVRVEDLRTPRDLGVRNEEDREWNEAQREREMRDELSRGKRKRDLAQLSWKGKEKEPDLRGRRSNIVSSSSSKLPVTSSTNSAILLRPIKPLPSSLRKSSKPPLSNKLQSLASELRLASALKSDPFNSVRRNSDSRSTCTSKGVTGSSGIQMK